MGSIYAELILGIKNPRVGLLNIGEEETKGNEQALATYPLLKEETAINFIGNVEGRDINKGTVDVVVCDGFVGNVVLKVAEGLATAILTLMKDAVLNDGVLAKIGALLIKPALMKLKKKLDPAEHDIAELLKLGADGVQMGSRFAASVESNGAPALKEFYLQMTKEDVVQIDSPVGYKGRAILNPFAKLVLEGNPPPPITCDAC